MNEAETNGISVKGELFKSPVNVSGTSTEEEEEEQEESTECSCGMPRQNAANVYW